jgi:hypothetical protein
MITNKLLFSSLFGSSNGTSLNVGAIVDERAILGASLAIATEGKEDDVVEAVDVVGLTTFVVPSSDDALILLAVVPTSDDDDDDDDEVVVGRVSVVTIGAVPSSLATVVVVGVVTVAGATCVLLLPAWPLLDA